MKPTNATLNAILAGRQFFVCDLITFTLQDGTVLTYTSAQTNVVFGGSTFVCGGATGPYFDRKDNKAKVVWNLGVGTDTLVIDVLPGSTALVEGHSWFDAVRLGLFDGADFEIDRGYSTAYAVVQAGCAPMLFKGRVAEVEADRAIITFSINDYRELLNQQMPRWLYAASCQNDLYDASCTLISTNFQSTGTVSAGSSFSFIVNSTLAQASGYFDQGKIKFTSGANNGLSFPVSSWSSSLQTITLACQTPFLPVASDQFTVTPGCDLSTAATGCAKFSNIANFRGMPYIPDPGQAL
jgi:uncharacterized phage protein (TIGR02218 family)